VATINRALAEGRIDEDAWHQAMADLIKPAYLAADSPYGQAGHGGDAVTWKASRGFIADGLHQIRTCQPPGERFDYARSTLEGTMQIENSGDQVAAARIGRVIEQLVESGGLARNSTRRSRAVLDSGWCG
jgi:hypothetical protein